MAVSTSGSLRAQCLATSQHLPSGESREGPGHGSGAWVTPKRTPPNQVPRTRSSRVPPEPSLREGKGMKVVSVSRGTPEHRDLGA